MARENKRKGQQVNRVRRVEQQEDINLGSTQETPEDIVKKARRKGEQTRTKKPPRMSTEEVTSIRKGRIAKQKEYKESTGKRAPRKSELEKEYTHELQKLRNRLKYREKQGFFVRWETLPSKVGVVSQQSIDMLKSYQVKLNERNEIELERTQYSESAREFPSKLRVKYADTPNYDVNNDPSFIPPEESVQYFDVFERIERAFIIALDLIHDDGALLDHPLNEDVWVELSFMIENGLQELYDKFIAQRDSHYRQEYAIYLLSHEDEIVALIDVYIHTSDREQAGEVHDELGRYIEMH